MEPTPQIVAVREALDVARAAVVAAAEARCAARVAELEAGAAVQYAADAVDKASRTFDAVKISNTVEANRMHESLNNVDFKYVVSIKNSLRYVVQEMRRQSTLLHSVNNLVSGIPEVDGGKVGKVTGHLDHVYKMLEKTSIICEQDLENKYPSWDFDDNLSDVDDHPSERDVDDLLNGYVSEDPEIWEMVFLDQKYEENKEDVSLYEHCKAMGYNFEEIYDRTM